MAGFFVKQLRGKPRRFNKATNRAFSRALLKNYSFPSRSTMTESMKTGSIGIDPPGRNLDYECGYPDWPTISVYRRLYDRDEYSKRVCDVWADECWSVRPQLYETEDSIKTKFERAWDRLNKKISVWHYLHRLDRICGLGSFGIMLLGFNDGKDLSEPVQGIDRDGYPTRKRPKKQLELIYMRPFAEDHVFVPVIELNKFSPRYGQPRWYDIRISVPAYPEDGASTGMGSTQMVTLRVHWSRVIHVADNCESSDVFGTPRMRTVLNRLLDIRKILSASAEMFWKGGFPGFSFETIPELLGESIMDEESVREQFEEYMDGLKRYLALDGATVKQLFPQVADPSHHVMEQVASICATIGVPMRIFMGSESGHLASTQDSINMNKRVARRQGTFCEPVLIRQLVDRLIMVNVLPQPGRTPEGDYFVSWTDLNTMSDKDKALVSLQRAQALMQYVSGQVEAILPPEQFFTLILGLSHEESQSIMKAVNEKKAAGVTLTDPLGDAAAERDNELAVKLAKATPKPAPATGGGLKRKPAKPQGGGRIGKPSRRPAGRPSGNIQQNRAFSRNGFLVSKS